MNHYEINPHARFVEYATEQAFRVVKGDDRIRTGESAQRIDCASIVPHDGLTQLAIVGLLVSLAVLVPMAVLYAVALSGDVMAARWCAAQWSHDSRLAGDAQSLQPKAGV